MSLSGRGTVTNSLLSTNNALLTTANKFNMGAGYRLVNINLGLLDGGVSNVETVTIQSSRGSIDNSGFFVNTDFDPDTVGFDITTPSLSGVTFSLASTSASDTITGVGGEVVRVIGLDTSWNPQFEDVVMTGQTASNTTRTDWIRVNSLQVVRSNNAANDTFNVGFIYITDTADTFTAGLPQTRVYCAIGALRNISTHGIFSIKAGYSFISSHYKVDTDATAAKGVENKNRLNFLNIPVFELVDLNFTGGGVNYSLEGLPNVPEKSDIIITSQAKTATVIDRLTCWWSGTLKKNTEFPNAQLFNTADLLS